MDWACGDRIGGSTSNAGSYADCGLRAALTSDCLDRLAFLQLTKVTARSNSFSLFNSGRSLGRADIVESCMLPMKTSLRFEFRTSSVSGHARLARFHNFE